MKQHFATYQEVEAFVKPLAAQGIYVIDVQEHPNNGGFDVQWMEHKFYTSYTGEEYRDEIWTKENGDIMLVQDIEPEHCRNILRMILRQERESAALIQEMADKLYGSLSALAEPEDDFAKDISTDVPRVLH
jgi:hypothetical protein